MNFIIHKPGELQEYIQYVGLFVSTPLLPIKSVPPTPSQQLQLMWVEASSPFPIGAF